MPSARGRHPLRHDAADQTGADEAQDKQKGGEVRADVKDVDNEADKAGQTYRGQYSE